MASNPSGQNIEVSLNLKAMLFISLMILAVGAVLGWYFLRRSEAVIQEEVQKRTLALTQSVAHNSRYGILTEDSVILEQLLEGVLKEDSVIFAMIADSEGKLLARVVADDSDSTSVDQALEHALTLAVGVTESSIHYHPPGTQNIHPSSGIYHAIVPVLPPESVSSNQEQELADALAMFGGSEQSTLAGEVHGSVQLILSLDRTEREITSGFVAGVGLTLAIILVGVLISYVFVRYTLTPVRDIARAAQEIAAGDFSQQIEARSRDEIGVLASSFNSMSEALQKRLAELSALHNVSLAVSSTLSVDRIVELALEAAVTRMEGHRARLFMVDESNRVLSSGLTCPH
jgi:HAMP domain-containing protein